MIGFTPPPTDPRVGSVDYYLNGAGALRTTIPRTSVSSSSLVLSATQIMTSYAIVLYAGDVVTNITFRTGGVAAVNPTNWWFALYDTALNKVDQTADQLTAPMALGSFFTKALGLGAYTVPTTGVYYISIMVKADTIPTMTGFIGAASIFNQGAAGALTAYKQSVFSSGSSLVATAPSSITGTTTLIGYAWGAVS